ncbi:MAG TPA: ester cyclase [Bryobacteraceae bacterium]|nr:ester cyclase [Bryobacteraceae bacterium]
MLEDNKALARKVYEECFSKGKLDLVDEIYSKDCTFHDPVFPQMGAGAESMRRHIQMCRSAFPDLRFVVNDIIAEKDEVVLHWTATGTQQGQFLGVVPTHRQASVTGTSICRIKNGKIIEQFADWNLLTMLEQLGAATAPRQTVAAQR